jgi:hypothetical protein
MASEAEIGAAAREAVLILPASLPALIDAKLGRLGGIISLGRWPGGKPFDEVSGVETAPALAAFRALDSARGPIRLSFKSMLPGPTAIA